MLKIAFICTANMCRSAMAHAMGVREVRERGQDVEVYSGGTMDMMGTAPVAFARETCDRNGTPLQKETSTFVGKLPLAEIDRFLVMQESHRDELMAEYDVPQERIALLGTFDPEMGEVEIADPIGQEIEEFERCYARMQRCIGRFLETIAETSR